MTQPDPAFVIAHFEAREASKLMATLHALAITQLMFDLCSAQIMSWPLRDGRR